MIRIKEIRNQTGLTSSLVAQVLGLDLRVYMMIENHEISVTSKIIEELCYIFGCEEKVFFHDIEFTCINLKDVNYEELCDIVHFRKIYATMR